jgi:hypothetical protein
MPARAGPMRKKKNISYKVEFNWIVTPGYPCEIVMPILMFGIA